MAYSSERRWNAEEIEAVEPNISSEEIPSLEEMLSHETTEYPFEKVFDEVRDDVAFIAHSSGTTGWYTENPYPCFHFSSEFAHVDMG